MVSKSFTLTNKMGFHMRPAQVFVTAMAKYSSDITITFNGKDINGKSIMNIMAACMKCGSEITVSCNGADEEAMLSEASLMIESGFGEE
ncbi:MAG: HPr family phosphocarrier protein [Eubacterium sp.]|nr:HPr family phosphocarrier protein [Eubacterium sp.]MBR7061091.1 HPr family phosphocarrier protein [Eubacterium sp.]